jgi:nicotinate phosphoribosyltransferase
VTVARKLAERGIALVGVRLDSGDLAEHARRVRAILDAGGLMGVRIFASGGLDEHELAELVAAGAPIDGFGVGTRLDVSNDAPYLDCAYKLVEYAGKPRLKRSEGKATWPGAKQVYRRCEEDRIVADRIALENEPSTGGEALVECMIRSGRRVVPDEPLAQIRARATDSLAKLPAGLRSLAPAVAYPVEISATLRRLAS